MSKMWMKRVMAAGVAGAALAGPAVASADVFPRPLERPTTVAGYGGVAMWSEWDAEAGGYRLMQSVGGAAPQVVPVAERPDGPFDVDLGTNRSGSLYAVYTRDGDVYRLRVSTGVERRLTSLSSPSMAERDPTIQRGQIAFVRRDHGRDQLRVGNTTRGSHGTRMLVKARRIVSAELGIGKVAYVVREPGKYGALAVHVRNIRTGHDLRVYRAASGGANGAGVTKPSFTDDLSGFVWARTNTATDAGNRLVKYTLRGGTLSYGAGSMRYASSAWVSDELGAVVSTALDTLNLTDGDCVDAGTNYCSVGLTGPVAFDLAP